MTSWTGECSKGKTAEKPGGSGGGVVLGQVILFVFITPQDLSVWAFKALGYAFSNPIGRSSSG